MKKRFKLICAVLLALAPGLAGQTSIISSGSEMITFMNSNLDYIRNNRERYDKIEGSAYLDEEFHPGSVYFNGKKYMGLQLRHNPYEGYFEFRTDAGIKYFDPLITPIDTVWMDSETYLYLLYKSGKQTKKGYMRILNQGRTQVFEYSQIKLLEPEEAKAYEEPKPARFEKQGEILYIKTGNDPALEFKNKKSLEEIFPEQHTELSAYAKSEKMKLKKTEEIISLCAYYDSLRKED